MSKRHLIWLGLAAALFAQQSSAEEQKARAVRTFERKVTDTWSVYGLTYPDRDRNDVCLAFKEWRDGSRMEIVKDLKTGSFYVWHQTMSWNRLNDETKKDYPLRVNFYDATGKFVDGGTVSHRLWNKNTFTLVNLSEKTFMKAFVNANRMLLIPEGNVGNVQAYFDGKSNDIALALADCVAESGRAPAPAAAGARRPIEPPSLDLPVRVNARDSL